MCRNSLTRGSAAIVIDAPRRAALSSIHAGRLGPPIPASAFLVRHGAQARPAGADRDLAALIIPTPAARDHEDADHALPQRPDLWWLLTAPTHAAVAVPALVQDAAQVF